MADSQDLIVESYDWSIN